MCRFDCISIWPSLCKFNFSNECCWFAEMYSGDASHTTMQSSQKIHHTHKTYITPKWHRTQLINGNFASLVFHRTIRGFVISMYFSFNCYLKKKQQQQQLHNSNQVMLTLSLIFQSGLCVCVALMTSVYCDRANNSTSEMWSQPSPQNIKTTFKQAIQMLHVLLLGYKSNQL